MACGPVQLSRSVLVVPDMDVLVGCVRLPDHVRQSVPGIVPFDGGIGTMPLVVALRVDTDPGDVFGLLVVVYLTGYQVVVRLGVSMKRWGIEAIS